MLKHSVNERERSSTRLGNGAARGSEEYVSYSLLEAKAQLRQSHCLKAKPMTKINACLHESL